MSSETTYLKRKATLEISKNVVVNNKDLYKIYLEKECLLENSSTSLLYTLDIKCFETGVDIQAVLPNEVLVELKEILEDLLIF